MLEGTRPLPRSEATSSASSGCARPLKTMRFFSVVRFIPVTVRSSWFAGWVRSGFSTTGAGLPNSRAVS